MATISHEMIAAAEAELDAKAATREIGRLTAELAASQERERVLREAIEKAPHRLNCAVHAHERISVILPDGSTIAGFETRHMGLPCDCWKRAALGEP